MPWVQHFDFSLPIDGNIQNKELGFFPPAAFNMLRNPRILDVVESLIGPEIYSNPVQHVRLKPPENLIADDISAAPGLLRATAWHQDASVVITEADDTEMITVWVPIFDSTVENGCLQVVPRNHHDGMFEHCPGPTEGPFLNEQVFDVGRAIPVPMRQGSALFMSKTTPHGSLGNRSNGIRWSLDIRYSVIGQPTGRPEFPGFVARSRSNPQSELRNPETWRANWEAARARLLMIDDVVSRFSRSWSGLGCA
jgi:phytanoyl-CoA hydroxylase